MSLLDQLGPKGSPLAVIEPPDPDVVKAPMQQILDVSRSPVLAEIDALSRLRLMHPFDSVTQLARRAKRTPKYIATMLESAAFRAFYMKVRKDLDMALDLPTIAQEIDSAARVTIARLVEKVETTDDGYLIKQAADVLLKARGQGGFAPPSAPITNILIDARQAAILHVREKAMDAAREAGPPGVAKQAAEGRSSGSFVTIGPTAKSRSSRTTDIVFDEPPLPPTMFELPSAALSLARQGGALSAADLERELLSLPGAGS